MKLRLSLIITLICFSMGAFADNQVQKEVINNLRTTFPGIDVTQVRQSVVNGLYEVLLGAEVIYASADGRYILQGDLIDIKQKRNLSEEQRSQARVDILRDIPESESIIFSPENPKHSVYVFTDITCGYCRKLHRDVPELNDNGIAVHYLAFPRQGLGSPNDKNMQSIWCANDKNKALTDAKFGKGVKDKQCNNPVTKQFELGQVMGVRGTPAIYLENGQQVGGYLQPAELIKAVNR